MGKRAASTEGQDGSAHEANLDPENALEVHKQNPPPTHSGPRGDDLAREQTEKLRQVEAKRQYRVKHESDIAAGRKKEAEARETQRKRREQEQAQRQDIENKKSWMNIWYRMDAVVKDGYILAQPDLVLWRGGGQAPTRPNSSALDSETLALRLSEWRRLHPDGSFLLFDKEGEMVS